MLKCGDNVKIKKKIIIVLAILVLIGFIIAGIYINKGYKMYKQAIMQMSLAEKIEEIKSLDSFVPIEEMPIDYLNALIAVEDHRFYEHGAVDIISIARAIFTNVKELELQEGGSTITQQTAKNLYFTQEKKLERKIAEIFLASKLEKEYEKKDILELYVNTSYFGTGYYGVKDAAKGYYDKELKDLTLWECTMLAGIPNAPNVYAPNKKPELGKQRQKQVIQKMVKYGYITGEQGDKLLEEQKNY